MILVGLNNLYRIFIFDSTATVVTKFVSNSTGRKTSNIHKKYLDGYLRKNGRFRTRFPSERESTTTECPYRRYYLFSRSGNRRGHRGRVRFSALRISFSPIDARPHNITGDPAPEEYLERCARVIQKCWHSWKLKQKFLRILKYYSSFNQVTSENEQRLKTVVVAEQQRAIVNLQYPTKTSDFEALYLAVDEYDDEMKARFESGTPTAPARIENNRSRLTMKRECLKDITKRRLRAKRIADETKTVRMLNAVSEPVVMTLSNGKTMRLETMETQQAKQLTGLFAALTRTGPGERDRIAVLEDVKRLLGCFRKTDFTKPIASLVDRELVMLNVLRLDDGQLRTLRKRIEILFLCFITQPNVNPALKRTWRRGTLLKCYNCRTLKPLNMFVTMSNLKRMTTCKDCQHLRRITTERTNLAPHVVMLKDVKSAESRLGAESSVAFVLNVEDIYYLATVIWNAKSALSECRDMVQLRLVRWCNRVDWSPTNTILLTIEEAYVHSKVYDLSKTYASAFVDGVRLKHMAASRYFKGLIGKALKCDRELEKREYDLYNS